MKTSDSSKIQVVLTGRPNCGKSTIFNALTGLRQHTGNWSGKTVESVSGEYRNNGIAYEVLDIPGIYSLEPISDDERSACKTLSSCKYDVLVIVLDSICLDQNLSLCLSQLNIAKNAIVCLNLSDEAERKQITIDEKKLSELLNVPVVKTSARSKKGIPELKQEIEKISRGSLSVSSCALSVGSKHRYNNIVNESRTIYEQTVKQTKRMKKGFSEYADAVLLNRLGGSLIMLFLLFTVFWITIAGANYPSLLLQKFFSGAEAFLHPLLINIGLPSLITEPLMSGCFRILGWVVSVMLPPMAIFFPLFSLLEDCGLLPRIAFMMDGVFSKAGTNGKNALSMCMGFGCNACGVTSCRIMTSKRDKTISILTNSLVPCNGKFPSIILLTGFIFNRGTDNSFLSSLVVAALVVLSVFFTLALTRLLSSLFFKVEESFFFLELPPYRKPNITQTIFRSLKEKTLKILVRAVVVSAPCGLIIWLMQNITIVGMPLLLRFSQFLNPAGFLLGFDGVVLSAFILGIPANEIVIPIMLMCYSGQSTLTDFSASSVIEILSANGWSSITCICTAIFFMFHFPCATTLWTIKKELSSVKMTILAFLLPTAIGVILCSAAALVLRIIR